MDSFAAHLHSRRIFLLKFQRENATAVLVYCKWKERLFPCFKIPSPTSKSNKGILPASDW